MFKELGQTRKASLGKLPQIRRDARFQGTLGTITGEGTPGREWSSWVNGKLEVWRVR